MNIKMHLVPVSAYPSFEFTKQEYCTSGHPLKRPRHTRFFFHGHRSRKTIIIGQINRNMKRTIFDFECNEEYARIINFYRFLGTTIREGHDRLVPNIQRVSK